MEELGIFVLIDGMLFYIIKERSSVVGGGVLDAPLEDCKAAMPHGPSRTPAPTEVQNII